MTSQIESPAGWAAGGLAGACAAIFVSPFDVLKTRLQIQNTDSSKHPLYRGILGSLRRVFREEGYRGLFRGLPPTLLGYVPSWAIYFNCYEWAKLELKESLGIEASAQRAMLGAVFAGCAANTVTNPFWVVRTRLQAQRHFGVAAPKYSGTLDCLLKVIRGEGPKALLKGLAASYAGLSHVAIQFPVYEECKSMALEHEGVPYTVGMIGSAVVSKICASALTYPHEVLRSRMQVSTRALTLRGVALATVREEGPRALYAGFATNLVRVVPACAITFLTYEIALQALHNNC